MECKDFEPSIIQDKIEHYIDIKRIAEIKGLKSTRSIRIAIQKGKYIAREVKVNGGTSYEILVSSLEPELQQKLREAENKSTDIHYLLSWYHKFLVETLFGFQCQSQNVLSQSLHFNFIYGQLYLNNC